jgi:hypothetical protein
MHTPTLSPAAAAAVGLFANLTVEHMGGGCFALHMPLSDTSYLLITSQVEECFVPVRMDEPVLVGHYSHGDDNFSHAEYTTLREALQELYGNVEGETMPAELLASEPTDEEV